MSALKRMPTMQGIATDGEIFFLIPEFDGYSPVVKKGYAYVRPVTGQVLYRTPKGRAIMVQRNWGLVENHPERSLRRTK